MRTCLFIAIFSSLLNIFFLSSAASQNANFLEEWKTPLKGHTHWKTWKHGDTWAYGPIDPKTISSEGPEIPDANGCFQMSDCLVRIYQENWSRPATGWYNLKRETGPPSYYDTVLNRCRHPVAVVHCLEKQPLSSYTTLKVKKHSNLG